jgi:hypothetical protein
MARAFLAETCALGVLTDVTTWVCAAGVRDSGVAAFVATGLIIAAKTGGVGQDFVGGLGPREWVAAVVPSVDECGDRVLEFAGGCEGSTSDGLPGDDAEEHFDEIEPGP